MTEQYNKLAQALAAVVENVHDAQWMKTTLNDLGRKLIHFSLTPSVFVLRTYPFFVFVFFRHAGYNVKKEHLDCAGGCLLDTLAQVAGGAWTPHLKKVSLTKPSSCPYLTHCRHYLRHGQPHMA